MNGLEPNDFDGEESREETVATLIADSEARFSYEHVSTLHDSGNKMLTKYWYRQSIGTTESSSSIDKTTLSKTLDIGEKKWCGAIENKPDVLIKVENPQYIEMKSQVRVLGSGLTSLEKQHGIGLSFAACLKEKSKKDATYDKMAVDCQADFDFDTSYFILAPFKEPG